MRKWYTCTPVAFKGDHTFFYRDSGLFSRAFAAMGCESKAIMPLPAQEGDWQDHLIRTGYANLENPEWWKSLNIDGVLLYSWGAPKYEKVAEAIHASGVKLFIYLDTSLGFYPIYSWLPHTKLYLTRGVTEGIKGFIKSSLALAKGNLLSPFFVEPARKRHLLSADIISTPLPYTVAELSKPTFFYKDELKRRMVLVGCPIASHFTYDQTPKEELVIAIGRWNDVAQKRPGYLRKTLELALSKNLSAKCLILGLGHQHMERWRDSLPGQIANRITIRESLPNTELPALYNSASVCLCSSQWESTHIVSAEALCCGCSIVAPPKCGMEAFAWYTEENSGTLSAKDTPASLADALVSELDKWKSGDRNPDQISRIWQKRLHAEESAKRILHWDRTGDMPGIDG